jgi:hypothetical protein
MKRVFLFGVIVYSAALLLLQDWPAMANTTGAASAPFLALMVVDAGFAITALFKMFSFGELGLDEDDDEVSIHAEDVQVPDTWFYGVFGLTLLGHAGWHGYEAIMNTGAYSLYASVWFMAEIGALFLTYVFFRHASAVARREARKARNAAKSGTPRAVA